MRSTPSVGRPLLESAVHELGPVAQLLLGELPHARRRLDGDDLQAVLDQRNGADAGARSDLDGLGPGLQLAQFDDVVEDPVGVLRSVAVVGDGRRVEFARPPGRQFSTCRTCRQCGTGPMSDSASHQADGGHAKPGQANVGHANGRRSHLTSRGGRTPARQHQDRW